MSRADRFAGALARKAPGAEHQAAAVATLDARHEQGRAGAPERVPLASVRRSPFQPVGRPSAAAVEAVRLAAQEAGSLAALLGGAGEDEAGEHAAFRALGKDARALALLAADVAARGGIDQPLEVRTVAGALELLSGHRRLAAAQLAGLADVPVVNLGAVPDAEAAELVYRRNRLREDFGAWQDARSVLALGLARRANGHGAPSRRTLAPVAGYSHAHTGDLLNIAGAWMDPETGEPRAILRRLGKGDAVAGEEALAGLAFRVLRDLAKLPERDRLRAARIAAGLDEPPPEPTPPTKSAGHVYTENTRGVVELRTTRALDTLREPELRALLRDVSTFRAAVRRRLTTVTKRSTSP